MSEFSWETKVVRGNSSGTGWITFPHELKEWVDLGSYCDLVFSSEDFTSITYIAKLLQNKSCWGFYIPKTMCTTYDLIDKDLSISMLKSDYFPARISPDRILRIPNSVVDERGINENDIYNLEVVVGNQTFTESVLITRIDRSNRTGADEYRFTMRVSAVPRSTDAKVKIIQKIERISSTINEQNYEHFYLPALFEDGLMGRLDENEMIIFLGNHVPVFTPIRLNLLEFVHYFGCYYADGTKKGWAWRINASTPEQAMYYLQKLNQLTYAPQVVLRLIYSKKPSDKRTEKQIKDDLVKYWKEFASIDVEKKNIKLRKTKHDNIRKWNKHGTLDIKDNRNLVMELHLRLLEHVKEIVIHDVDNNHCWNFLFGILEGDGFVSGGRERFGIGFSSHSSDKMIERTLIRLGIQYRVDRSLVRNDISAGVSFHFGLFEVLLNLEPIFHSLFIYYPKRRNLFVKRLFKQPTVRYLLGRKESLAAPARSSLLAFNLHNKNTRNLLKKLESEVKSSKN